MTCPLIPLGDRLIVEVEKHEKSKGGIFLPEKLEKQATMLIVKIIATGKDNHGLEVGMRVLVAQHLTMDVLVEGEKYTFCSAKDVGAMINSGVA